MFKKIRDKEIFWQFLRFCSVGALNTIIDYGVYLFFSRTLGLYFFFANIISVAVAMTFSFYANKFWTFGDQSKAIGAQYFKFFIIGIIYFLLYNAIFFIAVDWLNFFDLWAKVIAIGLGLFWNFFANRHWTFNKYSDLKPIN